MNCKDKLIKLKAALECIAQDWDETYEQLKEDHGHEENIFCTAFLDGSGDLDDAIYEISKALEKLEPADDTVVYNSTVWNKRQTGVQ